MVSVREVKSGFAPGVHQEKLLLPAHVSWDPLLPDTTPAYSVFSYLEGRGIEFPGTPITLKSDSPLGGH